MENDGSIMRLERNNINLKSYRTLLQKFFGGMDKTEFVEAGAVPAPTFCSYNYLQKRVMCSPLKMLFL